MHPHLDVMKAERERINLLDELKHDVQYAANKHLRDIMKE